MAKNTSGPLSPMELRFVEEMIKDGSVQKKAAIRAGYSIDTASQAASRMMNDPRVQNMIEQANKKAVEVVGITAARVLQELALIAFARPGDVIKIGDDGEADVDLKGLSNDKSSGSEVSISTVSGAGGKKSKAVSVKTVKPADKVAALVTIAKMSNFFPKEQIEVTGKLTLAELIAQSFDSDEDTVPAVRPEALN